MRFIHFDYMSLLFNPFVLMFITIALGLLFGKNQVWKVQFWRIGCALCRSGHRLDRV